MSNVDSGYESMSPSSSRRGSTASNRSGGGGGGNGGGGPRGDGRSVVAGPQHAGVARNPATDRRRTRSSSMSNMRSSRMSTAGGSRYRSSSMSRLNSTPSVRSTAGRRNRPAGRGDRRLRGAGPQHSGVARNPSTDRRHTRSGNRTNHPTGPQQRRNRSRASSRGRQPNQYSRGRSTSGQRRNQYSRQRSSTY